MKTLIALFSSIALLSTLSSCSGEAEGEDDGDDGDGGVIADECSSGMRWSGGNQESPLMHPGGDCIGCHTAMGEGPSFVVAGTVHGDLHDPLDCFGVEGAVVTITDANDDAVELVTNEAGNFFLSTSAGLAMPIRATVSLDGREISMATPQQTGACATCHTADGTNGAPGRILAP